MSWQCCRTRILNLQTRQPRQGWLIPYRAPLVTAPFFPLSGHCVSRICIVFFLTLNGGNCRWLQGQLGRESPVKKCLLLSVDCRLKPVIRYSLEIFLQWLVLPPSVHTWCHCLGNIIRVRNKVLHVPNLAPTK